MITKSIDLHGDWDFTKINKLGVFFATDIGLQGDLNLFIDYESYSARLKDCTVSSITYITKDINNNTQLCFYSTNGKIFIYPTLDKDYVTFKHNDIEHKYYITNKLKEYKQDFDDIVNS